MSLRIMVVDDSQATRRVVSALGRVAMDGVRFGGKREERR